MRQAFLWAALICMLGAAVPARALELGLHMDMTFCDNQGINARAVTLARTVFARYSRNSFLWHKVEPEQGRRDWSQFDQIVDMLGASGIEPIMCGYGSPTWASGATGTDSGATSTDSGATEKTGHSASN